jgi:hypothetical protein
MKISRRRFLKGAVLAGGAIWADPGRLAWAMGKANVPQGFREIVGRVTLNGRPAREGDLVRPGDVVATGPDARATFVAGTDAYLLRAGARLEIPDAEMGDGNHVLMRIRLTAGRLMGVFGGEGRLVETPTAVAGIRGTGLYVEAEAERAYICACYGIVRVRAAASPGIERTVQTRHHEQPLYVFGRGGAEDWIVDAPMKNHSDAELRMLEGLVNRKPPFDSETDSEGYGDGREYK